MNKILVLVEIHANKLFAYSPDYPTISRFGCDWSNVIDNFTKAFTLNEDEINPPEGYKLHFVLDINKFAKDYPFFNMSELAKYLEINESLFYQYKNKVKLLSEKRSLLILKGLERIGKSLSKLNTRV